MAETILTAHGTLGVAMSQAEAEALGADYSPEAAFPNLTAAQEEAEASAMLRQTVFDRHAVNRAGEILPADRFEKTRAAREKLARQTMETALDYEAAGFPAFLPRTAPRFWLVIPDPLHEYAIPDLPVRRLNSLPAVAAARRRPMLTHLEAHVDAHPESTMATFTAGPRLIVNPARAGELRDALSSFHRRVSNLNSRTRPDGQQSHFGAFGYRLDYRATELGTVYALPCGSLSIHPHAHTFGRFEWRSQAWPRRVWVRPPAPDFIGPLLEAELTARQRREAVPCVRFGERPPLPFARQWRALLRIRRIYSSRARLAPGGIPRAAGYRDNRGRFVAVDRGARWRAWVRLARFARADAARRRCFFGLMRTVWGAEWDFGKGINDVLEACKYTIKPDDNDALTPHQKAYLARELRGMRLVSCFGELAAARRRRFAAAEKGRKWRETVPGSEETRLCLKWGPDHNALGPRDLEARSRAAQKSARLRRLGLARFARAAAWLEAFADIRDAWHALDLAAVLGLRPAVLASVLAVHSGERIGPRRQTRENSRDGRGVALFTLAALAWAAESAPLACRGPLSVARQYARAKLRDRFRICARAEIDAGARNTAEARAEAKLAGKAAAKAARAAMPGAERKPNRIIARLAPAQYSDRISRPALRVADFGGTPEDFAALRRQAFVARMLAATAPAIREAEAVVRAEAETAAAEAVAAMAPAPLPLLQSSHLARNCPACAGAPVRARV